jgi:hypothetical protein
MERPSVPGIPGPIGLGYSTGTVPIVFGVQGRVLMPLLENVRKRATVELHLS